MSAAQHTVGTLIDALASVPPETPIPGLSKSVDSYRGYYEHVAIEPSEDGTTAGELLGVLRAKVGTFMYGYKGGEFVFDPSCLVFVAWYGDTGPMLCGVPGSVEFVQVGEPDWWA